MPLSAQRLILLAAPVIATVLLVSPAVAQERWVLEETARRGDFGDEVEFGRISGVVSGPGMRVYVGDGMYRRIVVLDSMLRPTGAFGRDGSGPGEFRGVHGLGARGDTLYVLDLALQRLTVMTGSGQVLWTQGQVPTTAGERAPPNLRALLADGSILVSGRSPYGEPGNGLQSYDRANRERRMIVPLFENGERTVAIFSVGSAVTSVTRPVHAADRYSVSPGGEFIAVLKQPVPVLADSGRATLTLLGPRGDTLWSRVQRVRPEQIPVGQARRHIETAARAFVDRPTIAPSARRERYEAYVEALQIPPFQVPFDRILVGRDGSVLLRRGAFTLEAAEWWRVVDGRVSAVFSLPTTHEVMAAEGRRIWTATTGALDEPVLVQWDG